MSDSTAGSSQQEKDFTQSAAPETKDEAGLVWKYDIWLLPTLVVMCLFQAIDKTLIGIAKIDGIEADRRLTQHQYNTALSIFQVGYLLLQIPSNLLVTRVRPSIYLPLCCIAWSTVAVGHVFIRNYTGLLVARILLGVCDAPFWVGAIHVPSSWYLKNELVTRTSVLLASLIVAFVAISPMSAGIMEGLEGYNGWRDWRWLFLVFGLSGFIPAIIGVLTLPDYPDSHKRRFWLSEAEQALARKRMKEDKVEEGEIKQQQLWNGLKDAMKDIRT